MPLCLCICGCRRRHSLNYDVCLTPCLGQKVGINTSFDYVRVLVDTVLMGTDIFSTSIAEVRVERPTKALPQKCVWLLKIGKLIQGVETIFSVSNHSPAGPERYLKKECLALTVLAIMRGKCRQKNQPAFTLAFRFILQVESLKMRSTDMKTDLYCWLGITNIISTQYSFILIRESVIELVYFWRRPWRNSLDYGLCVSPCLGQNVGIHMLWLHYVLILVDTL